MKSSANASTLSTPELESLVRSASDGDEQATKKLIQLTQNRLFRFCVYLCGNKEVAQDLCQETYLRAFKNLSSLEKNSAFGDWLFRIAKNVFLDSIRNNRLTEELNEQRDNEESPTADPSLVIAVQQVLSQFEANGRMLLILVEIERYSYAEAAEVIGVSEDAVRSRLHRLRKEFIKKWESRETK